MEYKQGLKWLSRARTIDFQMKDKVYLIEALYTCCGLQGISYDKISVVSSPENKLERIIADIDKAQRELQELREQKQKVLYEISQKIGKLESSPEKTVLMGFYVGCRQMEEVGRDIGYATSYCYDLRRKGIEKL